MILIATAPAPGALRQRARAPRPRARRRGRRAARFTFAGETRELGLEPDWLDTPTLPDDEEWRIDWVKFYYGLDLADALPRHRRRAATSTRGSGSSPASSLQVPPDHDTVRGHRAPDPQLDLRLAAAAGGDASAQELVESLREPGAPRPRHLTPERNHRTLELYALLLASLALPD